MADEAPDVPEPTGAVRLRLAGLAADVLPDLDPVPPRLRRIADFAPARRARLGGEQVLEALAADEDLRLRVAALVDQVPAAEDPDDPADRAARAWLLRGPGWEQVWATSTELLAARTERHAVARDEQQAARAEASADRARAALEEVRTEARHRAEELRAEVADLRRKLGEVRAREREARRSAEDAATAVEEARRETRETRIEGEAERRRLRGRVEELEAANAALRRADRGGRDEVALRVRVLLDTVAEAAAGLRRELVLPTAGAGIATGPGERVERAMAERSAAPAAAGAVREGAAALEQYLAAPRARLLVDGYNVSKAAWPEATLEDQRSRLLRLLAPVVARTGAETTVVFDAAATRVRPVVPAPRGVRVLFSPYGVIADDVIAELVEAEPEGRPVVVVSSDAEVARHATRHAARAVPSTTLLTLLS